jgi:hydrogenase nickel incorporation protein HypB
MCDSCGCGEPAVAGHHIERGRSADRPHVIHVGERLLADNRRTAAHNRAHFDQQGVTAVNVMGTPGSGKTALLTATIAAAAGRWRIGVIEGDQATRRDAERIAATGAPAVQVETGLGCHLDAEQVHRALDELPLAGLDLVFIENVGNLVCPALFDLGAHLQVVVTSPTEGADKPLKYPPMFRAADLVVLNKIDLLPHVPFDLAEWSGFVERINPRAPTLLTRALQPGGIADWLVALAHLAEPRRREERV